MTGDDRDQRRFADMVRIVAILTCAVLAACATRRDVAPPAAVPPPTADLTPLFQRGCYTCLEQVYVEADARGLRQQAFEAATLLTLRSKELGLPFEAWFERARERAPLDASAAVYLEIVAAIPQALLSGNRDVLQELQARQRARTRLPDWRDALRAGSGSDLFRAYLDVSLVCAFGRLREDDGSFSEAPEPFAQSPLYQYRIGICDGSHADRLKAVRAQDAEFVDADFALGRYALGDPSNPDPETGLKHLAAAAQAFPASPAIVATIGDVHRGWEEWEPALAAYDAAIAVSPNHPEAMLGRTISLSRLLRSREAIDAATRMIELGQWRIGEAYYWRAWNHLLRGDIQLARRDADSARPLMANAALFVLSGTIEWRLRRLESAEHEFQQALTMDLGECEAAFNLGVVRGELGKESEALAAFQQARQCYELSIQLRRTAIETIRSGPGTAMARTRAAAVHERVLADLEDRRSEVMRALEVLAKLKPS